MPSYSGMRPKIVPPAVAAQDFLIQGPRDHGVDGLINLFGIESPGLTSSLAIADHVGELAGMYNVNYSATRPGTRDGILMAGAQDLSDPSLPGWRRLRYPTRFRTMIRCPTFG